MPRSKGRRKPEAAEVTAVLTSKAGRRRRRWPWVVLLVVALLGAGGAGAFLLIPDPVPKHPVPNLIARDRAAAEGVLRASKFVPVVDEQFIDKTTPGTVTDQTPKAGTGTDGKPLALSEGKPVTLVVSKGPAPTPVPDLADMTEAKARTAIEGVGHFVGAVDKPFSEDVAAGQVIAWTHKGESPPKGATVDLTVSAGPAPRLIPDLSGKTYDQAVAALDAKGLKAARAADAYNNDDDTKGKVVIASPVGGSTVARGSTVTLTVSKGRPEVPSLTGASLDEAKTKLAAVGLSLGGPYGPGGTIFLTRPGSGSKVAPGSTVDVYVI